MIKLLGLVDWFSKEKGGGGDWQREVVEKRRVVRERGGKKT